jgi:hypothetical protein
LPPEDEPPDVEPDLLVRVVTGFDPPFVVVPLGVVWERLVRVVTGLEPAAELVPLPEPTLCEPLVRVATAPDDATEPLGRCEPLAPVLTEPFPPCPGEPVAIAPRGFGDGPAGSWRMTWIVRRITCVRTSTGVRDASATLGLSDGRSANAAKAPAAIAVRAARSRVERVRIVMPPGQWVGGTVAGPTPSARQASAKLR